MGLFSKKVSIARYTCGCIHSVPLAYYERVYSIDTLEKLESFLEENRILSCSGHRGSTLDVSGYGNVELSNKAINEDVKSMNQVVTKLANRIQDRKKLQNSNALNGSSVFTPFGNTEILEKDYTSVFWVSWGDDN